MNKPSYSNIGAKTPHVEILPLIDVVFLVLVAFIYASMFLTQNTGLPVSLSESSEAVAEDSVIITLSITKESEYFIDEQRVSLVELYKKLVAMKVTKPDAILYIKGDQEAKLYQLVTVMDIAKKGGIKSLTIATDKIAKDAE